MDIDDYDHGQKHTEGGDFDMMIDEEVTSKPVTAKDLKDGTEKSKWANASSELTYPRPRRNRFEEPAYLDDDPTLTAPRRPFRPEHVSYSWAVS